MSGGEHSWKRTQRVRGKAGEAVLYPASTLHRVEPVTRGSRLVAISW